MWQWHHQEEKFCPFSRYLELRPVMHKKAGIARKIDTILKTKTNQCMGIAVTWAFQIHRGTPFLVNFEWDELRRSQSATSGPNGDTWTKNVVTDSSSAGGNNTSALLTKGTLGGSVNKTRFERNFPSLGTGEISVIPKVGRVPSPGLSSGIQSLGHAAAVGGKKWTSALAEVQVLVGSNGIGISSVQQYASTQPASSTTTSRLSQYGRSYSSGSKPSSSYASDDVIHQITEEEVEEEDE